MNTQNDYVKGEESLTNWAPRGVSLIRDHIAAKRRKQRLAEIEAAQPLLNRITFPAPSDATATNGVSSPAEESSEPSISDHDRFLLEKYLKLWTLCPDPISSILTPSNVEPPSNGVPTTTPAPPTSPNLLATLSLIPKNPNILKGGYLLTPSADSTRWVRRFVELRRPYLYIHSVPDGEEISIVSLRNSRVDHQPEIARLLRREGESGNVNGWGNGARGRAGERADEERVFAVYGTDNTWLFKARSEREKVEWIWKVDQSYFGSGSVSGNGSGED
jgi:kinesin family protein 1